MSDELAKIVSYLETYAANIRRELAAATRDADGRASLFTNVGLAEHAGIDLEAAAAELAAAAAGVARGVHLGYRRRGENVSPRVLVARYMRDRGRFAAIEAARSIEAGAHMETMT